MMNRYSGLSALSPIAQQAEDFVQKKNIPQDQVVPFLLSMRMPGLAGAVAQKMRLDQTDNLMKQMQSNPPAAPPTVVQENANKLQNAEAMLSQGMGAMPAGVMDRAQFQGGITGQPMMPPAPQPQQAPQRMAGGGPVAFSNGGGPAGIPNEIFDWDTWNIAYQEAQSANDVEKMSRLKDWAAKNLPTFSKYATKLGETGLGGIARGLGKTAAAVGVPLEVGSSVYKTAKADPGYVAEEYGFDPNSKVGRSVAGGLSYLENLANIPTFGAYGMLRGETPQERALQRTEKETKRIGDTAQFEQNEYLDFLQKKRNPEQIAAIADYRNAIQLYGANSPQAKAAEEKYNAARGTGGVSDQQALAEYMARSAKGGKEGEGGKPTLGAPPAFYDVKKDESIKAVEKQLTGIEDVSKEDIAKRVKDQEFKDKMKFYEDQGITKPFMDAQTRLKTRRDQLELAKDKDFGKALALMGFTMMKTKGNFLAALGEGGSASLAAMETFEEKRQAALDKLDTQQLAIDQQLAGLKQKAGEAAEAKVDKLEARRNALEDRKSALIADGVKLRESQIFNWGMQERTFAANIDAIDRRYGGNYERQIEKDLIMYRNIMSDQNAPANVRAEAKRKFDAAIKEREAATQGGSAAYQLGLQKMLAQQALFGGMPGGAPSAETGGVDDIVAKYLR